MGLRYYGKHWKGREGRPDFEGGDMITPNGNYRYGGNYKWPTGEYRQVLGVVYNTDYDYWSLEVFNPELRVVSKYNPRNFIKEHETVAPHYQKTKYCAVKLDPSQTSPHEDGLCTIESSGGFTTTPLRDTASMVKRDVEDRLQEGDRWMIIQTHSLLEAEPPRPPIRITEYK